jgi:hypothetical protein
MGEGAVPAGDGRIRTAADLPEDLQPTVGPVLRDLETSGRLSGFVWWNGGSWMLYDDAGRSAVGVGHARMQVPLASHIVHIADQVSDWVTENQIASWPECPRHPGRAPLSAVQEGDRAVWVCRRDDVEIAEIGKLNGPT